MNLVIQMGRTDLNGTDEVPVVPSPTNPSMPPVDREQVQDLRENVTVVACITRPLQWHNHKWQIWESSGNRHTERAFYRSIWAPSIHLRDT